MFPARGSHIHTCSQVFTRPRVCSWGLCCRPAVSEPAAAVSANQLGMHVLGHHRRAATWDVWRGAWHSVLGGLPRDSGVRSGLGRAAVEGAVVPAQVPSPHTSLLRSCLPVATACCLRTTPRSLTGLPSAAAHCHTRLADKGPLDGRSLPRARTLSGSPPELPGFSLSCPPFS